MRAGLPGLKMAGMRVVCGIDASPADEVTVRQACMLAGARGHVALVCAESSASTADGYDALERAMWQTRSLGVRSSAHVLRHLPPTEATLTAALDGEALVVTSLSAS